MRLADSKIVFKATEIEAARFRTLAARWSQFTKPPASLIRFTPNRDGSIEFDFNNVRSATDLQAIFDFLAPFITPGTVKVFRMWTVEACGWRTVKWTVS